MSDEAIYSTYYAESGLPKERVREVWNEIAFALKVPGDKIRPTDAFGKEIGSYLITSDEIDTLFEAAQKRAAVLGIAVEFSRIRTVDEYVRRLAVG
jgi:hypothetical protein